MRLLRIHLEQRVDVAADLLSDSKDSMTKGRESKCEAEVVATDCEDSEESQENQINDLCSTWDWQHRHQTITR